MLQSEDFDPADLSQMLGALRTGELTADDALAVVEGMMIDPQVQAREVEARRARVSEIGHRLQRLADEQVQLRQTHEERWLQDVRQYNGQYEPGTFSGDDESSYGSRLFVPLTRRLVNIVEGRLFDMFFPSDERFYALAPTPVPDLSRAKELAGQLSPNQPVDLQGVAVPGTQVQQAINALFDEARQKADAMQREIDDALAECGFPAAARRALHQMVLLGTGVLKGPVPMVRRAKRWVQLDGAHALEIDEKLLPVTEWVDLWDFFPDMSATTQAEAEFVFQRHYMTRKQLADLQHMPGVDAEALRKILKGDPKAVSASYREGLRSIHGTSGAADRRYEVWEYHGPLMAQELQDCGVDIDDDPLIQRNAVVWFCDGTPLKAALAPTDDGSLPFSVMTWQRDESGLMGLSLPYEVRDPQVSANAAYRAMHDSMGLCALPMLVVDDTAVQPVDGRIEVAPGKAWRMSRPGADARTALQLINVESRLAELQAIFSMSKALVEEVATLPAFMSGTDAPGKMQSATEASIGWTAANIWVRRAARCWDDDVVTPIITRYYDWMMEFSDKEDIKGDLKVVARGVSALVELEGSATRMNQFLTVASQMGIAPSNKYQLLREFAKAFKIDPDKVLPSPEEVRRMQQAEQQQGPPPDPSQMRLQLERERLQFQAQEGEADRDLERQKMASQAQVLQGRMQLEIADTAAKEKITQQEAMRKYGFDMQRLQAELTDRQAERDHKSQLFNAEAQLRVQTGAGV